MILSALRRHALSHPQWWPAPRVQTNQLPLWRISFIALLMLVSVVHPSRTFAANPDLEKVLTGSQQRIQKLDYRVTGRLTRVEADGKRTNYKLSAKAHWFPAGLRVLSMISG